MKRILVCGAGGSPAVNFTRSIRKAPEPFYIVGTDASRYYLHRAETDARYLIPTANDPQFLDVLNHIIEKERIEFLHVQNDDEVKFLSSNRERIGAKTLFPAKQTVNICHNKFGSFEIWRAAGIKVPKTVIIKTRDDVAKALEDFGGKMWLRAISGAGGRGSLPVSNRDMALKWIDFQNGWDGSFSAAELLSDETATWMSIWNDGRLVAAQGRRRLYWELGRISPSGVTGATGAGETVNDPALDEIAQQAVKAIDKRPTGLFGVDLTYDADGMPNPTEINIGRFFTTHQFFTELGLNMPYIFTKLGLGEPLPSVPRRINPVKEHMVWIRGMDFAPVLVSMADIEKEEQKLEAMKRKIRA